MSLWQQTVFTAGLMGVMLYGAAAQAQSDASAPAPPAGAYFPSPISSQAPTPFSPPADTVQTERAAAPPAASPPPQWVQANNLSPTGSQTCSMNADLGGSWSMSLTADQAAPTIFALTIAGPYAFPADGPQRVALYYDHGFQALSGTASGNSISVPLDANSFPQFLHGFTAGRSMLIAEGSHPAYSANLTGSSAAVSALGQCTEAGGFTQLPPPWHAAPAAVASNSDQSAASNGSGADAPPTTAGDQQAAASPATPATSAPQAPTTTTGPGQAVNPAAPDRAQVPTTTVAPQAPPSPEVPPLGVVITALNCSLSASGIGPHVQGILINNTGISQALMRIVEIFSSDTGSFVSTTNTFVTYNPVLPGQSSPFEDYGGNNPVISSVQIAAATEDGEELPTSGQTKATCEPSNTPSF